VSLQPQFRNPEAIAAFSGWKPEARIQGDRQIDGISARADKTLQRHSLN
jgi:hypothetical protein